MSQSLRVDLLLSKFQLLLLLPFLLLLLLSLLFLFLFLLDLFLFQSSFLFDHLLPLYQLCVIPLSKLLLLDKGALYILQGKIAVDIASLKCLTLVPEADPDLLACLAIQPELHVYTLSQ